MRIQLQSNGKVYTVGFLNEVQNAFQAQHQALTYTRHQEGEIDGKRWIVEFATDDQLRRLQEFSTSLNNRNFFVDPERDDSSWTPAHELVAYLFGEDYPVGADGLLEDDCKIFRWFWQPFVREPIGQVISTLGIIAFRGHHKLQDCHYVIGFIDGALGLSEKIRVRLNQTTSTSSLVADQGGKSNV